MIYEKIIYPKNALLKQYIHTFWILRSVISDVNISPYLLPPDRYFHIILSYKSNTNILKNDNKKKSISGSFIVGMRTTSMTLIPDGEVEYLGIEFFPHSFRNFINFNCSDIKDKFVEISLIQNELIEILKPVINEYYSDEKRIDILEQRLLIFLNKTSLTTNKTLFNVFNIINQNNGSIPINKICDNVGISERQLNRDFEKFIGVSPKFYSRIVRFNNFLENIKSFNNFDNFADLAYHCGYFDQAHMIHECIDFTDATPIQLINKC